MKTKEEILKRVLDDTEKCLGVRVSANHRLETLEKISLINVLRRGVFSGLRLSASTPFSTLAELADAMVEEQKKKEEFFKDVLQTVSQAVGKNCEMKSPVFDGADVDDLNFFFDFSKLLRVLEKKYHYTASYALLRQCQTPQQLAEVFYRRGRF